MISPTLKNACFATTANPEGADTHASCRVSCGAPGAHLTPGTSQKHFGRGRIPTALAIARYEPRPSQ